MNSPRKSSAAVLLKNTLGEKSNLIHVGVRTQIKWDIHEPQISPTSETSQNHTWWQKGQSQKPVISQNMKIAGWHILIFLHYDLYWIRYSSRIQSYPILFWNGISKLKECNKWINSLTACEIGILMSLTGYVFYNFCKFWLPFYSWVGTWCHRGRNSTMSHKGDSILNLWKTFTVCCATKQLHC